MSLGPWLVIALLGASLAIAALYGRRSLDPIGLGLHALAAIALYLALFPPERPRPAPTLTVLTAGAELLATLEPGPLLALPEAGRFLPERVEAVPDLATALRRYPDAVALHVLGTGLEARDRDHARTVPIRFAPGPARPGLSELDLSERIPAGGHWRLHGRLLGLPDGSVELLDPAQRRIARAEPDRDGRFALTAVSAPGRSLFTLRALDAEQREIESLVVPVVVETDPPLRILSLAGAPGPEWKYLHRWLLDAGVELDSRIALTRGVALRRGAPALTAAALADIDVVLLDERAWRGLGGGERERLRQATRQGLGLLLRLTDTPSPTLRAELAEFGFAVEVADLPREVVLPGPSRQPLSRRPLRVDAETAVAALRDEHGEALALWRAWGRGRIGLVWLTDSYRLVLAGDPAAHGSLWSGLLSTLARPGREPPPWIAPGPHRPDHRVVICGLRVQAEVIDPNGAARPLSIDPVAGGCAGYWPSVPGWHRLRHPDGGGEPGDAAVSA